MKKILFLSYLWIFSVQLNIMAQEVPLIIWPQMEQLLTKQNDTTYVVNFWATWCRPCIAELPYFEQLNKNYKSEKLKVILVSLDFDVELEQRLKPFLNKRGIQSEVYLLNEPDANTWINKVSPDWSGAIPATVIYRGNDYSFYEKSFQYKELDSLVNIKLKN